MNRNASRRLSSKFLDYRILFAAMGLMALAWACYAQSVTTYSLPQASVSQWMIEFRAGEEKVQMTLRYDQHNESHWGSHSNSFQIAPDQLIGLTREQAMSSGAHVQFQLKRDAGTFNCEGWFKDGNGSGHFTLAPNAAFVAELMKQGYGEPTYEQQFSMAMSDTSLAFIKELRDQGYEQPTLEELVQLGNHGVRLEYIQGLKSLGYMVKSTDLLRRMRDHGVSVNYIRELQASGY